MDIRRMNQIRWSIVLRPCIGAACIWGARLRWSFEFRVLNSWNSVSFLLSLEIPRLFMFYDIRVTFIMLRVNYCGIVASCFFLDRINLGKIFEVSKNTKPCVNKYNIVIRVWGNWDWDSFKLNIVLQLTILVISW